MCKEIKENKTKLFLIAESKNLRSLKELFQCMEEKEYFQDLTFNLETSLPSSYAEAQEDEEMLSKETGFSDAAVARTFPFGTRRILFFESFFKKGDTQKEIYLLHELAHQVIYNSGVYRELYSKAKSIQNIRVNISDERTKGIFERIANHQIVRILSLPDEIMAEKLFYEKWSDLFDIRVKDYFEGDKASLDELVENMNLNRTGNADLQKIINRILFIKSIYTFYDGESKEEHLLLINKYEGCIKEIAEKTGFGSEFIFDYIEKIVSECIKIKIDSDKLIDIFSSYRKDFLREVFNYKIE